MKLRILCHLSGCIQEGPGNPPCHRCGADLYNECGGSPWLFRPGWVWWLIDLPHRLRRLWPWRKCGECRRPYFRWPWSEGPRDCCSDKCLYDSCPF